MMVNNKNNHVFHVTLEMCLEQIGDPFQVFTKLYHVRSAGTVKETHVHSTKVHYSRTKLHYIKLSVLSNC